MLYISKQRLLVTCERLPFLKTEMLSYPCRRSIRGKLHRWSVDGVRNHYFHWRRTPKRHLEKTIRTITRQLMARWYGCDASTSSMTICIGCNKARTIKLPTCSCAISCKVWGKSAFIFPISDANNFSWYHHAFWLTSFQFQMASCSPRPQSTKDLDELRPSRSERGL